MVAAEAGVGVAAAGDPPGTLEKVGWAGGGFRLPPIGQSSGQQGVLSESVQDIGQQQLLVLLFVLQAEFQHIRRRRLALRGHRGVDMGTVGRDALQRRTGQQAAHRAGMPGAHGFVVGVEQKAEIRVEHAVFRRVFGQDELLEEPGRVGPVPLCRAGVGHGLDALVLGRQMRCQRFGMGSDGGVARGDVVHASTPRRPTSDYGIVGPDTEGSVMSHNCG